VDNLLADGDAEGVSSFITWTSSTFPVSVRAEELKAGKTETEGLVEVVFGKVKRAYELKVASEEDKSVRFLERHIVLNAIDSHWQDYLRGMDALRQGVSLRAYGQRDPLVEYKREAYQMFGELMDSIKQDVASAVFRSTTSIESFESFLASLPKTLVHDEVSLLGRGGSGNAAGKRPSRESAGPEPGMGGGRGAEPLRREEPKVGRNDPCSCGSGKKYKKCCGA
jgi:preprotein translocase subunit SecA